jgi:hypothetical protein
LLIPAYLSLLSVSILLGQAIYAFVKQERNLGFNQSEVADERNDAVVYTGGIKTELARHVKERGGVPIFFWKLLRLATCLALVGVTIAIIVDEKEASSPNETPFNGGFVDALINWSKKKRRKRRDNEPEEPLFTKDEWYQLSLCLVFVSHLVLPQ